MERRKSFTMRYWNISVAIMKQFLLEKIIQRKSSETVWTCYQRIKDLYIGG